MLTVNVSEARQSHFPMGINVLICALVNVLHQVFLKQQWMVSTHGAGTVVEPLVIVADVCLSFGREEFINIHFITEGHHDHNACQG